VSRLLAVLAALLLLLLGLAAPAAQATPLLDEGDAAELAQSLAEATAAQNICYGWSVAVEDQTGGPSGLDEGSNLGPDVPLDADSANCERRVVLQGQVVYTCESCEAEDASAADVQGSFPEAPTLADVEELGFDAGALKNEDGDTVLVNMVGALPLLTASAGAAEPVPVETEGAPRPGPDDVATGTPSTPDWLRDSAGALALCLALIVAGLLWLLKLRRDGRTARTPRPEGPWTTSS
jgi:hypothetical protein